MGSKQMKKILIFSISGFLLSTTVVAEQQYASKERSTIARAHMSRARTLLVEALAEFEESKKYARPDMLIDSEDWRLRVISLTEQLNRVVDPKPRVTREGAVFRTPPRFIKRQKEQLPEVIDAAKSRSDIGERARLKEKQQERAQFFSGVADPSKGVAVKDEKASLSKLPEELKLPAEPVLESPSKDIDNTLKDEKMEPAVKEESKGDLFTNELMPEVNSKEDGISKKLQEKDSLIEEGIDSNIPEPTSKKTPSIIEDDSVLDDEAGLGEERDSRVSRSDTSLEKKGTLKDNLENELAEDLPPEVQQKQISEDEELAKKLEDSISKKLSERNN